jgi:hypothetical protein
MRITSLCFLLIAAGLLNVLADVEQVRIALTAVPQEMVNIDKWIGCAEFFSFFGLAGFMDI